MLLNIQRTFATYLASSKCNRYLTTLHWIVHSTIRSLSFNFLQGYPNTTNLILNEHHDINDVRKEIISLMRKPDHDDGSLGPVFIRLAWHSCGTYDKTTNTGGSAAGATMRFPPECDDPENRGLEVARNALERIKAKFPWMSYADLWVLAGTTAIMQLGGPKIEFRQGRKDHPGPISPIENGRLPSADAGLKPGVDRKNRLKGWKQLTKHIREIFERMGFNDKEMVALISGGHVFGRGHVNYSGYAGAWAQNPVKFSKEYAEDLLGDDWKLVDGSNTTHCLKTPVEVCPARGKRQYISIPEGERPQMMIPADMIFLWDDNFRVILKRYAEDESLLKTDFACAWKKLIELGCENVLE